MEKAKVNYIFDVLSVELEPSLMRSEVLAACWHNFQSEDRLFDRQTLFNIKLLGKIKVNLDNEYRLTF